MQRWVSIHETNCDPIREAQYNEWCDGIHIPDVLTTPGFVRARRFQGKEFRDGRGKYMTLCEIETDDIEKTMEDREQRRSHENELGRGSASRPDFEFPVWRDVLWSQISVLTAPRNSTGKSGKWLNFVELNCDPAREDEFREWYDDTHLPDVLRTPGFVSATRYRIKEFRNGRGKYLAIYGIETDDIENTMKVRLAQRAEAAKHGRSGDNRPHLVRQVWRDVLWRQLAEHKAEP